MTNGMKFERVFSAAGRDPYQDVEWTSRVAEIKDDKGNLVFKQEGCRFPSRFSQLAVNVVASKYFYGPKGGGQDPAAGGRESSFGQLVGRIAPSIAKSGRKMGYFATQEDAKVFEDELTALLLGQYAAFNSPVWFNVGLHDTYGVAGDAEAYRWDAEREAIVPLESGKAYEYPQGSACFIQQAVDDLGEIMKLAASEARLFKYGSGAGADLSPLRSTFDHLTGGGSPSGPVSFLRIFDTVAGQVKSGGKCLAPYQPVFTATGVKTAKDLADSGEDFVTLGWSQRLGRMAAKTARAWKSGEKAVLAVITDKGEFHVSADHPLMLRNGVATRAVDLKAGMSLMPCSTYKHTAGYVNVGVRPGESGALTLLHRLVAQDICEFEIDGKVVHHGELGKLDNSPANLSLLADQAQHIRHHNRERVAAGTHGFLKSNRANWKAEPSHGMRSGSDFWKDEARVASYKAKLRAQPFDLERLRGIQKATIRKTMLDLGYDLVNAGYEIDTFLGYFAARKAAGRPCASKKSQLESFGRVFGTYDAYYAELRDSNHRVVEVRPVGTMPVYSVEVDDQEEDDKRDWSEHNYVLAPIGTVEPYMRGIVSLNTRRAARMQTLKDWHPDFPEFVDAKAGEEKKAKALIASGYPSNFNGEAYSTVAFQNTNLSTRVSDNFLRKATGEVVDPTWQSLSPHTGTPRNKRGDLMPTYSAPELLDRIAQGTWLCGDPGMQYDDAIQHWHTCPATARIESSNPCSEYLFINDSACNLSSINLVRFRREDGSFDVEGYRQAIRVMILSQEILVDASGYPTEKIARNSHDFRPLGLGYANLGGLIMSKGYGYDSPEARSLCGCLTAIMTGEAYAVSAEAAQAVGPFNGFELNREPMLRVIGQHAAAVVPIDTCNDRELHELKGAAHASWARAVLFGREHGFRNSQTSVLAPTGTIAFLMDCATTGIEPDIALVKYKQLAGGGMLKLANPLLPLALETLGYDSTAIAEIAAYVETYDTIEGCDALKVEHLSRFDCSFKPMKGIRSLHWRAHIGMMAAAQPFISGAISKTINMAEDATVEEIREAYIEGWRRGLKAVAIYRDGSKWSQPLSTNKVEGPTQGSAVALPSALACTPCREKLPNDRKALIHKFRVGGHKGFATVGFYADGRPGELFIEMAKEGSTIGGLVDTVATQTSIALQYGVPLEVLVRKFAYQRFEPYGLTTNPEVPIASSIIDYVFRWLGMNYVPGYREENAPRRYDAAPAIASAELIPVPTLGIQSEAPACAVCGGLTTRTGPCYTCHSCGSSSGGCG